MELLCLCIPLWVLFGIVAAMIGAKKGEGYFGFQLGILLGPFGILIALFLKGNRKTCPHCFELIHKEATVCSHCQRDLVAKAVPRPVVPTAVPQAVTTPPPPPEPATVPTTPCPLCGKSLLISILKRGENYCPHCFGKFIAE